MKQINLINQRIALQSASFNRFEATGVKTKLILKDSIINSNVDGRKISLTFKREAFFEPNAFFATSVEFIYFAEIDEMSYKIIIEDGRVFDVEYLKSIAKDIINNTTIPSHASLIIANNTSLNGAHPLITQPSFIE